MRLPRRVAREKHAVLGRDQSVPGFGHAIRMVAPQLTEHVHRLVPREGQMQVGQRKDSCHRRLTRLPNKPEIGIRLAQFG